MTLTVENITFDATHAADLAAFWSEVLQQPVDEGANQYFASIGYQPGGAIRPTLLFLQVPEPPAGKNRIHLDLVADDYAGELDRLTAAGAKRLDEHQEYGITWTTLADPDGNLFDVAAPHSEQPG